MSEEKASQSTGQSSPDPAVVERFLRYVQIDTEADHDATTTPSTEKQKDLSRLLTEELRELGLDDAEMDDYGYVYATLPASPGCGTGPVLALVAHVDTSPDEPGGPVRPMIHRNYDGSVIELPGGARLDPEQSPPLTEHIGHDVITSDGSTLLGSDDKAGVAIIMQSVADFRADETLRRPKVRVCFTVDEEIGRGVDKLDLERLGADVAYTIDGGAVGGLSFETFNAAEATVTVRGRMVHPGYAKGVMVNAGLILAELVTGLPSSETPEQTVEREGYFLVRRFDGSVQEAKARILLRDFDEAGFARRKALVEQLAQAARLRHPAAEIEVVIEDSYKNMRRYIEEKDPRTIELAFKAARAMGIEAVSEVIRGGTDGSRLSELGLPTPNVFTGGYDFHSRWEWNTVQNLETSLAYVKQLIRTWAEEGAEEKSGGAT